MTGIKFCIAKKFVSIILLFTMVSYSVSATSIGKDTSIESMEEYERIIGSAILPETFVPYEKVKMLGQMLRLVLRYQEQEDNGAVSYIVRPGYFRYTFKDATGMECRWYLEITDEDEMENYEVPCVSAVPDEDNLHDFYPKELCQYQIGDIRYYYGDMGLCSIVWHAEHCYLALHFYYGRDLSREERNAPLLNNVFISRLLDKDTVVETIEKFNTSLTGETIEWENMPHKNQKNREETSWEDQWVVPTVIAAAVIILAGVVTPCLLLRCKKRKKQQRNFLTRKCNWENPNPEETQTEKEE